MKPEKLIIGKHAKDELFGILREFRERCDGNWKLFNAANFSAFVTERQLPISVANVNTTYGSFVLALEYINRREGIGPSFIGNGFQSCP